MDTLKITSLLGDKAEYLLGHTCKTIDKSLIHIPSPSTVALAVSMLKFRGMFGRA